jgi:hypothetical protein
LTCSRKEPWAQHALAHVMLTQGRITEGPTSWRSVSEHWTGLNSFMVTHNWWHLALFALELDRHGYRAGALRPPGLGRGQGILAGPDRRRVAAARLELAGVDVGDRWQDVADHLALRLADHVQPFLDLQYLYGLARAGRARAGPAAGPHRSLCGPGPDWSRTARLAAGCRARGARAAGPCAWPTGAGAIDHLGQALPQLQAIGGSHAQRDLFEQLHLDALLRAGQWSSAQHLLQQRANGLLAVAAAETAAAPGVRGAGPAGGFPMSRRHSQGTSQRPARQ